ncbi:MAG: OmpH family outer membrane protein [Candidatus Marinimicrobia bacterium]|nr:OmpH family outer membrane protein [Candidatus Neomarinimicrobiota bacterium]
MNKYMKSALVGVLLVLPAFIFAEMKIGYIDSNKLMSEYSEVASVQAAVEKEQRKMETEFNNLLAQLDSVKTEFSKQSLLMSETRREEASTQIIDMETNIQNFQVEKFGPNGEIYAKQNTLLSPVLKKIDAAIQKVGAERGYDYIFDAVSGAIVYALDSHDLTQFVLDELKAPPSAGD